MRTGLEVTARPADVTVLDEQLRLTGAALVDALQNVPTPAQVPPLHAATVQDIRWHIAEALRINTHYRRRLDSYRLDADSLDRLAGSTTPAQGSQPQSLHDPPSHVTPGIQKSEEKHTP